MTARASPVGGSRRIGALAIGVATGVAHAVRTAAATADTSVDLVMTFASIASHHEADVRAEGRIREERLLQVVRPQTQPDGDREEVDDLVGLRAQEMGAEHALRLLVNEDLEARDGFSGAARIEPARRVLKVHAKARTSRASRRLTQSGRRQWRN